MAKQSSANVVWRALVMLVCLVAIPLAAVLGASLPDLVNRLLQLKKDLLTSAWAEDSPPEAPPMGPTADDQPWGTMAGGTAPANRGSWEGQVQAGPSAAENGLASPSWPSGKTQPSAEWAGGRAGFLGRPGSAVSPAGGAIREGPATAASFNAPIDTAAGATPSRPRRLEGGPATLVPVGPRTSGQMLPQAGPPGGAGTAPGYAVSDPRQPTPTDRFTYIQGRLRQLGATYYLLETWGTQGEHYRFHARMAMGGSTNYVRRFEATDPDALGAMAKVLEQVETWRAGS